MGAELSLCVWALGSSSKFDVHVFVHPGLGVTPLCAQLCMQNMSVYVLAQM